MYGRKVGCESKSLKTTDLKNTTLIIIVYRSSSIFNITICKLYNMMLFFLNSYLLIKNCVYPSVLQIIIKLGFLKTKISIFFSRYNWVKCFISHAHLGHTHTLIIYLSYSILTILIKGPLFSIIFLYMSFIKLVFVQYHWTWLSLTKKPES